MAKTRVGNLSPLYYKKVVGALPAILDGTQYPGNIFYVDSGDGSDTAGFGTHPDTPFATIDFAVGQCTANQGDVIYVLPGHVETVSAAGGLDLDVAGITIRGVGEGSSMPRVVLDTATTADVDVDAAGITVEGLEFRSAFADIAVCLDVNADDFTIRNCRFVEDADDENFLVCIQDAAAGGSDRITVEDCYALQDDASNTHFVNFGGTGKGHIIRRNTLLGDWGTMAIGGAGVVTFCAIIDNVIYNAASDNDSCINVASTATGLIARNLCGGAAAQANGVTTGNCLAAENYYGVNTEDLSAILDPIAT